MHLPAALLLNAMSTDSMTKTSEPLKTPLYAAHQALGAKIVDFGGWALPVNYGSQIEEHHAVRQDAGMFDVSHMTVSDITGEDTLAFLSNLLANDINKVTSQSGKALYSCMLNEQGGVIDDLIAYYLNDEHCRLVTNAATNEKDMAWIKQQIAGFDAQHQERPEMALIAIQGPNAISKAIQALSSQDAQVTQSLTRFQAQQSGELFIARTGYTGEDGLEIILPDTQAQNLWNALLEQGIQPCGLGARDTLRLEAGMALYGNDLDEEHTPIECGLAWTVSRKDQRDFIGKAALDDPRFKTIGLVLKDKGVLRGHQKLFLDGQAMGEITSGTFSPSLQQSIAMARTNRDANIQIGDAIQVEVRNKHLNCEVVKYPFYTSA
jgi:aminomethyltransferase